MRMNGQWYRPSVLAIACTMAAVPFGAQAQEAVDASAEAEQDENRIIVTARQREESLLEIPVPVTVSTQEDLERNQVRNIDDLQRLTPALEISQSSGGEANGGARLRGLGTGVFTSSVAPSVALVVDDVSIGNLAFPLLYDLAQVEVLRGPQGTLFGQGASAGVIKITTVQPNFDGVSVNGGFEFADKGTAGSEFGNTVVSAGFNLPLNDVVAVRVASQYQRETGLQRNTFTGKDNKVTDFGVRGRVLIEPSPAAKILITGEYVNRIDNAWSFQAYPEAPPGPAADLLTACGVTPSPRLEEYCSEFPGYQSKTAWGLSAVADFEVADNLTLTSVTAYRERNFRTDSVDYTRLVGVNSANRENIRSLGDQWSQELRFGYEGNGFDLVFGGFYQEFAAHTEPTIDGPFNQTTPGDRIGFSVCPYDGNFSIPGGPRAGFYGCAPFVYGFGNPTVRFEYEEVDTEVAALFADTTINLTDNLDLFGGIRYNDVSVSMGVAYDKLTPDVVTATKDSDISGRIGLSLQPSPSSSIFISLARGYKPPAASLVPGDTAGIILDPEKSIAFELGGRVEIANFLLSGNIFYTEVDNFQSQTTENVGGQLLSVAANIEKVESYGLEVNLTGELFPGFTTSAGYQFNRATYPDGYLADDGIDVGGEQINLAPKHKFTFSGEYSFDTGGSVEPFINGNLVYKSRMRIGNYGAPQYIYPAHELINMGAGIRDADGAWSLSLFARNLTAEREPINSLPSVFMAQPDGGRRAWPAANKTARAVGLTGSFRY